MKVENQQNKNEKRRQEDEQNEGQNQSQHSLDYVLSSSNTALCSNVNNPHSTEKIKRTCSSSCSGGGSITSNSSTTVVDMMGLIPDLVGPFKTLVTNSLNEILQLRPSDPLRVLAEHLRNGSNSREIEKHNCVVCTSSTKDSPVECTLTKACTLKDGAEVLQVPGIPMLLLVTPTAFELDAALRHLDTLTAQSSKVIVFVESPNPPTDLFFLKGVPYFANLTEQLLQRRRNGRLDETLNASVGSVAGITSLLEETLQVHITTLQEELVSVITPPSRFHTLYLPGIQSNVFDMFDVIDTALGVKKKHWDKSPPQGVPSVLLVSFNPAMANMTFSRLISAVLPLYEEQQRCKIAETLKHNKAHIRKFNYTYVTEYWKEVLQRRDERDKLRGKSKVGMSYSKTSNPSRSPKRRQQKDYKRNKSESSLVRARRREKEDTTFLHVTYELQAQAATRIQAFYRGYRYRRKRGVSYRTGFMASSLLSTVNEGGGGGGGIHAEFSSWVEELPSSLPPLLRQCMERLSATHGELFGNYTVSCPPEPRYVTVLKPSRKILKARGDDDNVDSESETWEEEQVTIPMVRQTKVLPHFNPLRRLMECEYLSGCNTIEYARSIQQDCTGLSVLQRRAYDCFKSLVLNLLHISFLELYHREKLPISVRSFDDYMHRYHVDVFGWLSVPHFLSRITLKNMRGSPNTASLLCESETMKTERLLVLCGSSEGQLYERQCRQKQEQLKDLTNGDTLSGSPVLADNAEKKWVCPGVYAAPDFLSDTAWEIVLQGIPCSKDDRKVAWWSLSPNPAVYINGRPFVLLPRHEMQEVEGRSRFDEFTVDIEKVKKTVRLPKHDLHSKGNVSLRADKHRRGRGGVSADGSISFKRENSDVKIIEVGKATGHLEEEPPLSTFGASLCFEDDYLVQGILRSECKGNFPYYTLMGPSYLSTLPITYTWTQPFILCSLSVRMSEDLNSQNVSLPANVSSSLTPPTQFRSNQSGMDSRVSGGTGRFSQSLVISPLPDTPMKSASLRSCSLPSTCILPQSQSIGSARGSTSSPVESVDTVARRVAQYTLKGDNFIHERPWISPVCGRAWVLVFERFISKCLVQLRQGYIIVLAVDGPSQLVLFNTVCLLKHAMLQQAEASKEDSFLFMDDGMNQRRHLSPLPSLLSNETLKCLSFMDSFYEQVKELVKQTSISVCESVHTVHGVMKDNAPGGLMFLEELPILIRSAEQETDQRILRETITTIVQRIELYCWLVLLQVFLSSQASNTFFGKDSEFSLSLFATFVDDSGVRGWMDRIDPWQQTPGRSPDPFHLRYTNGLRRWDDRNYISQGVV